MNIKNERVHALAREASRRAGTTQTAALEAALLLFLEHLEPAEGADVEARAARALALAAEFNGALTDADRAAMRSADSELYDEDGLPA